MIEGLVYVCQAFPWVTQTFTVREVATLREQGLDVRVVSFTRPPDELVDATGRGLLAVTTFVPRPWSAAFLASLARIAARHPLTFTRLTLLALVSPGLLRTPWRLRARGVLAVARGAWLAARFTAARLFHAELADEACTAAMAAAELGQRRFSFKSHASFNPQLLARKATGAAFVAVESEFDRRHYFAALPGERVLVNRAGVAADAPLEHRPASASLRILSVGTLQEKKGHRYLLAALRLLAADGIEFRCVIVGSGPLAAELGERIASYGLGEQVSLVPYLPHDEVARLYGGHDVFALPCVVTPDGDRDGIPTVLIEAAAAGCALVTTPVSGIPELVVDGESGLLVPEQDERALADALARLAGDPELRMRLAEGAGRVVADRFDLRRNVKALGARFELELDAPSAP